MNGTLLLLMILLVISSYSIYHSQSNQAYIVSHQEVLKFRITRDCNGRGVGVGVGGPISDTELIQGLGDPSWIRKVIYVIDDLGENDIPVGGNAKVFFRNFLYGKNRWLVAWVSESLTSFNPRVSTKTGRVCLSLRKTGQVRPLHQRFSREFLE